MKSLDSGRHNFSNIYANQSMLIPIWWCQIACGPLKLFFVFFVLCFFFSKWKKMVIDIHDRVLSYNYWITYGNGTKPNRTKFSVDVFKMNFNIPKNQHFRNWIQFLKFQFFNHFYGVLAEFDSALIFQSKFHCLRLSTNVCKPLYSNFND